MLRVETKTVDAAVFLLLILLSTVLEYAPVAQWIEHQTTDLGVTGSSPVGRAIPHFVWAAASSALASPMDSGG